VLARRVSRCRTAGDSLHKGDSSGKTLSCGRGRPQLWRNATTYSGFCRVDLITFEFFYDHAQGYREGGPNPDLMGGSTEKKDNHNPERFYHPSGGGARESFRKMKRNNRV